MVHVESSLISDERVAVGNGVSIPASWTVILNDEPGVPGLIVVRAAYDARLQRAVAEEVRVVRSGEGEEVTSLVLREVRVQAALQVSGLKVSTVAEPEQPLASGGEYIRRMRERTDRTLEESIIDAARLYQLAAAINLPPLRAVADGLDVSQSTATRLMTRARFDGLAPGVNIPDPFATGPVVGPSASGGPSIGR